MSAERGDIEARTRALLDSGDVHAAMTLAIRSYGTQVLGYLVTLLRSEDDACDVFSEVCEKVWTRIGAFRWESSLRAWIYRIAWTTSLNHRKRAHRTWARRMRTSEVSALVAEVRSSARGHEVADRALARVRASLDPADQTLLILRVDRGLSWKEVAEVLGGEDGPGAATLRKRFDRLCERLLEQLRAEGVDDG